MLVCPQCGGTYDVAEGFCPMDGAPLARPPEQGEAGLVGLVVDRRYRLDRKIGTGSMGEVYQATHTLIGKRLAVKVLRDEHVGDPKVVGRFVQEARLAGAIKHPNVVEISDFGTLERGNAYFVMELLEGRTLAAFVDRRGPLPPKAALSIALQVALGLGAAHEQGIVHRDLKAENVFLCDGGLEDAGFFVKLLDFGIARAAGSRMTAAGAILGTPEYMAPEQVRGHEVDARTDLYALGVILFELLVGRVPFHEASVTDTLRHHLQTPPPRLAEAKPELEACAATDRLIRELMAKSADERPESAAEVVARLRGAMDADLGAEMAERVHRSTLALGSATVPRPPKADPAEAEAPMGWGARTGGTLRPVAPESAPAPAMQAATPPSRPAPVLGPTDLPAPSASESPRFGVIMAAAAIVAAATTFAVVGGLGGFRAGAEAERTEAPSVITPSVAAPVERPPEPAASTSSAAEPVAPRSDASAHTDSSVTTSAPDVGGEITPPVEPAAPSQGHTARKPGGKPAPPNASARPKAPAKPASQAQAADPSPADPSAMEPAGQAPPVDPSPPPPSPLPKRPSKPPGGDLKDPFSGK